MRGLFITIEGAEGSGKSTQIDLLKTYLDKNKYEIVLTREPGGTNISEAIRNILLDKQYMEMSDTTEALLYAASRAQHVEQFIKPALEQGKIVICDRFLDSSLIYQGCARGLGIETIEEINKYATKGLEPDITILLDIEPKQGLKRKEDQKELDRIELQKSEFHEKVCNGFKELAKKHPHRIKKIDASKSIEDIHNEIISIVSDKISTQH
ncbi:MAG: dTMP kinase [Vallitalea sp.]|jgi:dTMP kinase|nr:dTMP kinase [Vallitalea sp.]